MSEKLDNVLLTPANSVAIFIDYQPQMIFGVSTMDRQLLMNNTTALAKAAKAFEVPIIYSTVETSQFSGLKHPDLMDVYPDADIIERSTMNSWEDAAFVAAVEKTGRKKLVMNALWTEVCLTLAALSALVDGYEVYAVIDTAGGTSKDAHDMAIQRMIQAGVVPVTWQQVMLEWQRDWARRETYDAVIDIARQHSGAYGIGIEYAYTMVHKQEPFTKS